MVDLGVYNFVKNALAAGKSQEEIAADLTRGGQSSEMIEEALAAALSGTPPAAKSAPLAPVSAVGLAPRGPSGPVKDNRGVALLFWLIVLFATLGGIGYYLSPQLSNVSSMLQGARQQYDASRTTIPGQ